MATTQSKGFMGRVVGAAAQGAAGAIVGASLSSVTEPIVNRVLVKRQTLSEAVKEVDFDMVKKFFQTTIATNLIKFPFFVRVAASFACCPALCVTAPARASPLLLALPRFGAPGDSLPVASQLCPHAAHCSGATPPASGTRSPPNVSSASGACLPAC